MPQYVRNHYVPQWFQYRFLPSDRTEKKFYYLDLKPETRTSNGHTYSRKALMRWGPPRCFFNDDLYTTQFGDWKSTEIEERFFGPVDEKGKSAVEYFSTFEHPNANGDELEAMLRYLSIQKLRTPKGLANFAAITRSSNKNEVLIQMQRLKDIFCALWTECVWSIADASDSETKFILSDHPITVYNRGCFPESKFCRHNADPPISLSGTHTIFPLCLNKVLLLTNLSWLRDPYGKPTKERPHPELFRPAMFNFHEIQTGRKLSEQEVTEINYIIKLRASRYIASAHREWLHPEDHIPNRRWEKLGHGYLLMPDPRSASFGREVIVGYENNRAEVYDEYGRMPGQDGFKDDRRANREWTAHLAFQGEFARLFGPARRGVTYEFGELHAGVDSADFHRYHLSLERRKPNAGNRRRRK